MGCDLITVIKERQNDSGAVMELAHFFGSVCVPCSAELSASSRATTNTSLSVLMKYSSQAVSDNTILVKFESPKRAALGQREEWLPNAPGTLKRATRKQLPADIDLYRGVQQRVAEFDRIAGELTAQQHNGRS